MKKAQTFSRCRNRELSHAARAFTLRTAASIVTVSRFAPSMRERISNENGAIAAARRAITFSNDLFFSGRCAWVRTSRISARAHRQNKKALRLRVPRQHKERQLPRAHRNRRPALLRRLLHLQSLPQQ